MEETRASTPLAERVNPVHAFAGRLANELAGLAGSPAWAMTPEEQAESLRELSAVTAQVSELRMRVLAGAERNEVGAKCGATSTAAWLAHERNETRAGVGRAAGLARVLDREFWEPTREAFAAGRVCEEQVRAIVAAVEDLPAEEVTDEVRQRAQATMLGYAAEHDAKALRVLGRRLLQAAAPEEADRCEGEALEREERRARKRCTFSMRENGDGTSSGWFVLPTPQAEMLSKAVQAFAAPRRTNPAAWTDADGERVPYRTLLGQAFAELVEHLPVDELPQSGGVDARVVVMMTLDTLVEGLGSAWLDGGGWVSAGEARRLACNAGIIPAVLGGEGEVLDVGRSRRLHTPAQRTAMAVRDRGCTAVGCDRPPAWCEAHHEQPWSHGGDTSVRRGRLLCPRHHRMAHDDHYDQRHLPDGTIRFARRT